MKATKRISAIFLALILALSLLPVSVFAAGSDYSTRLLVDKVADDKVDVKWMVQTSNGAVLKTTNSIIFKYDHTKYDMLTNDGTVITPKGMSENLFSHYKANYKQNVTVLDTPDLWNTSGIYAEEKGAWTFVSILVQTAYNTESKPYPDETALAVIHLKLKSGAVDDGLPGGSIALADTTEAKNCAQSGIVIFIGTGEEKFIYGRTDGTADTLLTPPVVAPGAGVTFAKSAYPGDIAAPTVNSNAGGKVVLNDAVLNPADPAAKIQYGYSTANDGTGITWQDGTTFTGLTVGKTYYFYAKVEGTSSYAEKVSAASVAVPVADKTLTNLEITTQPSTKTYTHGNTFKTDGMKVKATYNDGSSDTNFTGYTVAYETSGKNYLCKDNTKVTLKAGDKSVEVTSLTVGAKELTVTGLTAVEREYKPGDTSVTLSGGTLSGVVPGETVTLNTPYPAATVANDKAENNKDVIIGGNFTISGTDMGNYTLTQPTGIKVNITRKNINGANITLNTAPTYDGTKKQVTISGVTVDGSTLTTSDYDIAADTDKATNVESKELKITGTGNYKGTATKNWSLQKADPDVSDFDLTPATPDPSGYDYNSGFGGLSKPTAKKTGMGDVTVKYEGSATVPTNAGTYNVTFDVAEGTNYNTKTGLSIGTLKINQIDYAGVKIATDTVRSGHATTDKALTLPTLPAGASYAASGTVGGATAALISAQSVTGTTLTYSTTNKPDGTSATITIPVTGATNYNPYDVVVTITAQDKQTLTITGVTMGAASYTYGGDTVGYNNSGLNVTGVTTSTFDATTLEYIYSGTLTDGSAFTAGTTAPTKAGSYTLTVKVPDSNADYMGQQVINFTIAKKDVTITGLSAGNREYDRSTAATPTGTAVINGMVDGDDLTVDASSASATFDNKNVGTDKTVTFTGYSLSGADAGNYNLKAQPASVTADITAKDVTVTGITAISRPYAKDNLEVDLTGGTVSGMISGDTVTVDLTNAKGMMTNANAGTNKAVNITDVVLGGADKDNYNLTAQPSGVTVDISKIDHPDYGTTQTGSTNALRTTAGIKTYNLPCSELAGVAYAVTAKTTANIVADVDPTIAENVLTYTSKVCATANATDTITIKIESTNYNDIILTLTVTATDKTPVTISGLTYANKTYDGNAITPAGTLAVSDNRVPVNELEVLYTSTDGAGYSAATAPKDAGAYKVEYKVADSNPNYTGSVSYTFTISKKAATVAPKAVSITKGSAIPTTFELVYTGLVSGENLTPSAAPTFSCFEADGTTPVSTSTAAGTYTITWTNKDTTTFTGADNYDVSKTAAATLTISNPSYYGGGSYTPSYTVSVDKTENGTITVSPKSASKGDTVTITVKPDKGYELEMLKALDKDGDALKLTEKNGKYTFKMPSGKVTVKGSFVEEAPVQIFKDVPTDAYYYEAVKWAAEKGITGGVGNGLFAPNQPCTRAQIVTFLWRAAGSPAPKQMSSFTDVPADAFYAKAVAWAVENGITGGTGDGKFSPDATCTRAQAVTFLYRASGAPAVSGNAEFGDVATNAYYADAVAWAAKNGITGGIGGGLFGSDNDCTRAQIVTFLYRSVK